MQIFNQYDREVGTAKKRILLLKEQPVNVNDGKVIGSD